MARNLSGCSGQRRNSSEGGGNRPEGGRLLSFGGPEFSGTRPPSEREILLWWSAWSSTFWGISHEPLSLLSSLRASHIPLSQPSRAGGISPFPKGTGCGAKTETTGSSVLRGTPEKIREGLEKLEFLEKSRTRPLLGENAPGGLWIFWGLGSHI